MIKVENLNKEELNNLCKTVGDSFAYYHYIDSGANTLFASEQAMSDIFAACALCAYESGTLYATSNNYEGLLSLQYKGHDLKIIPSIKLIYSMFKALGFKETIVYMNKISGTDGQISYENQLKKKKIPYVNLGMLVVNSKYQGQGYMRKCMEFAYQVADRQKLDLVWDTDEKLKADKYIHLGASLMQIRQCGTEFKMFDLCRKYKE